MPGGLTLSQRLTGPDGLPTAVARAGAVALVCAGAALGYAAGPDGAGPPAERQSGAVAISRLSGELPIATPEPRPALTAVAALPPFRQGTARPERRASRNATPAPTPAPTATPEPSVTPEPVSTTAPPVHAAPAPAPAPAPKAPPAPRSTPAPTFDSEG